MDQEHLEGGDPQADGRAFRRSLGQFPTGVTIVTTMQGDEPVGIAVNSFAAVSLDPPLVLWSIRRESASADAFLKAGHFAINILGVDQVGACQAFGSGAPDRFDCIRWALGLKGVPLIEGAIAHLQCRLETVHEGGDHLILIGYVEHHARFAGDPLLFAQGQYGVLRNHPSLAAEVSEGQNSIASQSSFLRLLSAASQKLSAEFQTYRDSLGVSVAAARILHWLRLGPSNAESLQRATFLGSYEVEEALADLAAKADLHDQGGYFVLTDTGQQKAAALTAQAATFTRKKLAGADEADIAAAARVLTILQR